MRLRITEKCLLDAEKEKHGLRCITYKSNKTCADDAIVDFIQNFDFDNVIDSNDDFEESCLDSEVVAIEILEN